MGDFENAKENQLSHALENETEAALKDFFRYAIKLTEHTWGGCGSSHMNVTRPDNIWTSAELKVARASQSVPFIVKEELSWHEQRKFINKSIHALGKLSVADKIQNEIAVLRLEYPSNAYLLDCGYVEVEDKKDWEKTRQLGNSFLVAFDVETGSITKFIQKTNMAEWASKDNPLIRFAYRSHSLAEASEYPKIYNYNHGGEHPYHEPIGNNFYPGMNATKNVAKLWHPFIQK